ncbi:ISAs1 family transposase [Planctomycetes bacterium K23_9]|uniref:ISAs1 family transposase n=1 Tax=Stieleria marina TaxID=1930275 RepID=UPI0011A91A47
MKQERVKQERGQASFLTYQLDEVRDVDKGHGRIEIRFLQASSRLKGYLNWPGFAQAIRIERTRIINGNRTTDVSHAITSVGPDRAGARELLTLSRGHWGIENRLHWIRDVTWVEDSCGIRKGHGPENFATLRNASLTLLRHSGCNAIARTLRDFAARPAKMLKILRRLSN